MRVEVAGEIFTVADEDLFGSKTIEDLLQSRYVSRSNNEAIPIMVGLADWHSYLEFLNKGIASESALRVINYLDNLSQAQRWCYLRYSNILRYTDLTDNVESVDPARNEITESINKLTEFLPEQVLPIGLLTTFEDILTRLQAVDTDVNSGITSDEAKHIVKSLFSSRIYDAYNEATRRSLSSMTVGYMDTLTDKMFILRSLDEPGKYILVDADARKILREPAIDYYHKAYNWYIVSLHGDADFISPRVAEHYPNINSYKLISKNYIYCPPSKPFLDYTQTFVPKGPNHLDVTCVEQRPLWDKMSPTDVYSPDSKYRPFQGFATGLKLKRYTDDYNPHRHLETYENYNVEYELFSYNKPFSYNRDYYIYLPYEFDPIARVVYAFCV